MKNPFRTAPLPVRLAALLLIALPVTSSVIAWCTFPREVVAATWETQIMTLAGALTLAAGLLLGVNFLRLLFVAYALVGLISPLVQQPLTGLPPVLSPLAIAQSLVLLAALVLVLLPAAGRHFGHRGWAAVRINPALLDGGSARLAWALPLALFALFAASSVRLRMLAPRLSPERVNQAIYGRAQTPEEIIIGRNLRLLQQMADQYSFERPARVPRFEDLVDDGQRDPASAPTPRAGHALQGLKPAFGETYPAEYPPGAATLTATLPDGTRLVLERKTSKLIRFPGENAPATPPPVKIVLTLERAHELVILNNCRMLSMAAGQYSLMNGVLQAPFAELVGPGRMIAQLTPAVGEHYPPEISVEKPVVVTLKDGSRMTPDAAFSKLVPAP